MATWVLSPLAVAELERILEHIATDSASKAIADKVADDFAAALDALATSPNIGWQRTHLTGPGIRWWRVHSYPLAYKPATKPLREIRILHGARDLESLFEGLNAKVRMITRRAFGFHSPEALTSMVFLCCGGLHLTPPLPTGS